MKQIRKMLPLLFCLLAVHLTTGSCKDTTEEALASVFEIAIEDQTKELDKNAATISIPVNTTLALPDWSVESTEKWLRARPSNTLGKSAVTITVDKNPDEQKRTAQVKVSSKVNKNYTITITQYGANDVVVEEDIQVKPYGGKASEFQPGYDIDKTWDGLFYSTNPESHYHSRWGEATVLPVTLEYYFRGETEIEYLIYYSRSGNGNFGEVEVYIATDANRAEYTLQGSYDFRMQNAPSKVSFAQGVKATGIKFKVKSGTGGFVSCDEMQFFKKNTEKTIEKQLLEVFADITCTALKPGVTAEQIAQLPSYFVRVAEALQNNTYDAWEKEFRIRHYSAYSNSEEWAQKLMTKKYSNLDNPTGISVEKEGEVIVLVGDTHGQSVSLQCIGDERTGGDTPYLQTAASGDVYFLEPGVNKIKMRNPGQLFVMYNTDITAATAQPIQIHIPLGSGKVTGFFDLKEHQTDAKYADLLAKASHKYFCVRGEKIMFYFHTTKMKEFVPKEILSAIHLWDNIIGWQQELMGIEEVRPTQVNNHLFAISPEGSYMWASDYRIGFVYTYLNNILLYDNVMAAKDNAWGPAHEIGHIHQQAINWPSSTESSNNLFSNFVLYKLGKYCSRGSELSALATSRCIQNKGWWNMGSATHQNEDTEIHMRMNWQLWNYYHRCEYKPDFWQKLFKLLRENRIVESNPGAGQLLFAKMACKAANENLTDFFEMWGFFEPVNAQIEQYGKWNYIVTTAMIEEAKTYMASFPDAKHAFYYLEDRKNGDVGIENYQVGDVGHYTKFKDNTKITKNISCTLSDRTVKIENGDEAVAFEVKKGSQLVFFSNFLQFDIPASVSTVGIQIYAVQADGKRINIK